MQEPPGPEFKRLIWEKNNQHGWKVATREEEVEKHGKKSTQLVEVIEMYQSAFTRKKISSRPSSVGRTKKRERGSPLARRGVVCMYVCIRWLVGGEEKMEREGQELQVSVGDSGGCVADPKMSPPKIENREEIRRREKEGSNKAGPLEVKNCLNKNNKKE